MYEIENNIPIPPRIGKGGQSRFSVLRDLEIGQSFAVPTALRHQLNVFINRVSKETGRTFTTRKMDDGFMVRVWRVS